MSQSQSIDTAARQAPGDGISLGKELRRAREIRGVTLQQASEETRIGLRHLRALEADDLAELPGRLYGRNFVRSYGEYLGAEEDELLAFFDHQCRQADLAANEDTEEVPSQGRLLVTGAFSLAALVMLAVLAWSWYVKQSSEQSPEEFVVVHDETSATAPVLPVEEPAAAVPSSQEHGASKERRSADTEGASQPQAVPPQETTSSVESGAEHVLEAGDEKAPAPAPQAPQPIPEGLGQPSEVPEPEVTKPVVTKPKPPPPKAPARKTEKPRASVVKLRFTAPCWLEVTVEGTDEPIFGLKAKGDELSFSLEKPMVIKVFNAGGVRLTIDGQEAKPLGGEGEARTIHLDSKNWRAFLR